MPEIESQQSIKSITVEAVVTRADGTVEDLGVISYWHKNPLIRFWRRLRTRAGHVRFHQ